MDKMIKFKRKKLYINGGVPSFFEQCVVQTAER